MSDVGTLFDFAQELLDLSEGALAATSGGIPDRVLVAPSLPALDCCPQLTVHIQSLRLENTNPGSPAPIVGHQMKFGVLYLASFVITVVRCMPQPAGQSATPPSPAAITAASSEISEDLWAIWNRVATAVREGTLFEGKCFPLYLDPAQPIAEQGTCAGWTIPLRAGIQGYEVN